MKPKGEGLQDEIMFGYKWRNHRNRGIHCGHDRARKKSEIFGAEGMDSADKNFRRELSAVNGPLKKSAVKKKIERDSEVKKGDPSFK